MYGQNIYGQNIKNSLVLQLAKHMLFRVPSSFVPATRLWNWSKEMKWLILIWTEIFANCALSLPLSCCPSMNYIHSPYRLLVWFNTAKVCSLHPTACLSGLMAKVSSLAWVLNSSHDRTPIYIYPYSWSKHPVPWFRYAQSLSSLRP